MITKSSLLIVITCFLMTLLFSISLQIPSIQIAKGEEASTRDYGPITPWLSPLNFQGTEHLGEVDGNGHIHVFGFPDGVCNNWAHEDATASAGGQPVAGVNPLTRTGGSPLTSWVTEGPKEHVAGIFTNGHLIELSQTPNSGGWHIVHDATLETGGKTLVVGGITRWVVGPAEHVAGISEDGHLHEFFRAPPSEGWGRETDVTAEAARQPDARGQTTTLAVQDVSAAGFTKSNAGGVVSWVVGPAEHVAGISTNGHIHVFSRSDSSGWHAVDATAQAGGSPTLVLGGITSWVADAERIAGMSEDGHLHVFKWNKDTRQWQVDRDATADTGVPVTIAGLTSYLISGEQRIAGVSSNGHLHIFLFNPNIGRWKVDDASDATRFPLARGQTLNIVGLTSYVTAGPEEHVVGMDNNGHLQLFWQFQFKGWNVVDVTAHSCPLH